MANERKIINDVQKAVDGLSTSFKALDDVLSKNMANQKKLIANLNAIKKNLAGTKSLKEFVNLQKQMDKQQAELNRQQKAAIDIAKKSEQRKQQAIKTQRAAVDAAKKEQIQNEKLKQSKLRTEQAERRATAQKEKAEQQSREASRAYNVESKRLLKLTKDAKDAAIQYGRNSKQAKRLRIEQQKLDKQIKKVDRSLGQHTRNVGNYRSALGGMKNLLGAAGIGGGLMMVTNAFRKFGRELKQNAQIQNSLRQQYEMTNEELDDISEKVQVISNVYDKEYNEVITSANALSKEFGINAGEALDLIDEGFEKGADSSGEFLSMLREYPSQLKSVGLNADQTISIMTQSVREGVFSDKGVDAIKEAGLRLRELTKPTRDALDAIDMSSTEIEEALRSGSKSMFEVIQQVSRRLGELPDQSTEVGMALADIFGGPGEDAGIRYIEMLGDVEMSLDDVQSKTDPYVQSQRDLTEAWTETALSMQGANGIATKFNNLLTTILKNINKLFGERDFGVDISDFIADANKKTDEELKETRDSIEQRMEEINKVYSEQQMVAATRIQSWSERMAFVFSSEDWGVLPEGFEGNVLKELKKIQAAGQEYKELKQEQAVITRILNGETVEENELTKESNKNKGEEKEKIVDLIEIQEELLRQEREKIALNKKDQAQKNRNIKAIEMQIKKLKELGMIEGVEEISISDITDSYRKSYEEMEAVEQEYLDGYLDREQEKLEAVKEAEERKKELRKENERAAFELGTELVSALFERKQEQYRNDLEQNREYYDKLLASEKLSEEQRSLLEAQRQKKENEIREKQRENQRKQFLFEQGIAVAKIAIETAKNVAANPALAPYYISLGAIQTGIVLAQSIPKFSRGTENSPEGPAVVGEKGTELVESPSGKSYLTDDKPQMTYLEKGSRVVPHEKLMESINNYSNAQIVNNGDAVTGQDALIGKMVSRLLDENKKGNKSLIKAIEKNRPVEKKDRTIDRMRTDDLKNRLKN